MALRKERNLRPAFVRNRDCAPVLVVANEVGRDGS